MLAACRYRVEEYILEASALGIPNSRPRYYCVANHVAAPRWSTAVETTEAPPPDPSQHHRIETRFPRTPTGVVQRRIGAYVEDLSPSEWSRYVVPASLLRMVPRVRATFATAIGSINHSSNWVES